LRGTGWLVRAVLTLVLFVACLEALVRPMLLFRVMLDEVQGVRIAVNFFTYGQHAIDISKPQYGAYEGIWSVGIVSSWPAGVGWLVGGTMFAARVAITIYCFALAIALGVYVVHTMVPSFRPVALPLSFVACYLMLTLVPGTPHLVVQVLGEVSGALVLAWGIALVPTRSRLAAFVLGLCVWHTKFVYGAVAGLVLIWSAARRTEPLPKRARFLLAQVVLFLLPMLAWITLIWVQTGSEGLFVWMHDRERLFRLGSYTDVGVSTDLQSFAARLASPEVEWSRYATEVKVKIVVLLVLPTAWLVREIVARWRRGRRDPALDLLQVGLCAAFVSSAWWYFVSHRYMWLRHVTPFLLIGLGVLLYAAVTRAVHVSQPWQMRLAALVCLALAIDSVPRWPATAHLVASVGSTASFPLRCSENPRPDPEGVVGPQNPTAGCWETRKHTMGTPIGLAPDEIRAVP
jgi:hypothetical protein